MNLETHSSNVLFIAGGAGILVMGRILFGLSAAQGFGTLVDNCAVPIGLAQHGQAEGNEVFTGIRNIDSFAHDFLQSKEQRLCAAALVGRGTILICYCQHIK